MSYLLNLKGTKELEDFILGMDDIVHPQAKEIRQRQKRQEQKLTRDVHRAAQQMKDNPKYQVPDEEIDAWAEKTLNDLLHGPE